MNLSVSLSEAEVALVDHYRRQHGLKSRGEVVRVALGLLQGRMLEEEYRAAGEEWQGSEDAILWERTSGDGL